MIVHDHKLFIVIIPIILLDISTGEEEDIQLRIIGEEKIHKVATGSELYLECPLPQIVRRPGTIMLWRKGDRVLTAGDIKVRRDSRLHLIGNNLRIDSIGIHDGGKYSCEAEVEATEPLAVVHIVEILVPPSVKTEPKSGEITVREGTSVSIKCMANGNPSPTVKWSRNGKTLKPDHLLHGGRIEMANNGMSLTLHNAHRNHSGLYVCAASNGVGKQSFGRINLIVFYSPVIKVSELVVEGGTGYRKQITCTVHSEPKPEVRWFKNSIPVRVGESLRYKIRKEGSHHHLIVKKVGEEDFANYTCSATNSLGKTETIIQLKGNPSQPQFESRTQRNMDGSYPLKWFTTSHERILEYRLMYRLEQESDTKVNKNEPTLPWSTIVINSPESKKKPTKAQSFNLEGLKDNTSYQAKVMARNKFGWSDFSQVLSFTTNYIISDPWIPDIFKPATHRNQDHTIKTGSHREVTERTTEYTFPNLNQAMISGGTEIGIISRTRLIICFTFIFMIC